MSKMTTEFMVAFVAMQAEIPVIGKTSRNDHGKYNYADLAHVCDKLYPVLRKHGFGVSQVPDSLDGGPSLRTVLVHTSGGYIEGNFPIKEAGMKSSANTAQQFGSAISYVRRYGLLAIVGAPTDDDDAASVGSGDVPEEMRDPRDNPQFQPQGRNPRDDMGHKNDPKMSKPPVEKKKPVVKEAVAQVDFTCKICQKPGKPGQDIAVIETTNGKRVAHKDCYLDSLLAKD